MTEVYLNKLVKQLFPPYDKIPPPKADPYTPPLSYSFMILVGRPGSGKTTMALTVAALAERYYSREFSTTTIYSDSVPRAFKSADAEITSIIVDDADVEHPSRSIDSLLILYLNRFRHILYSQGVRYTIIMLVTHRWKQLLKDLRSFADMIVFKSVFMDPADNKEIEAFIGKDLFYYLMEITKHVFRDRNPRYNSYFVYKTAWDKARLGKIVEPLRPTTIVDVRKAPEEKEEEIKVGADIDVEEVIESLVLSGWSWHRVQKYALPILRTLGVSISSDKAYAIWRSISRGEAVGGVPGG